MAQNRKVSAALGLLVAVVLALGLLEILGPDVLVFLAPMAAIIAIFALICGVRVKSSDRTGSVLFGIIIGGVTLLIALFICGSTIILLLAGGEAIADGYYCMQNRLFGSDYHFNAFQDAEPQNGELPVDGDTVPNSEWEDHVEKNGGTYVEDGVTKTDKNSGSLYFQLGHSDIDNNTAVQNHLKTQLKNHIGR